MRKAVAALISILPALAGVAVVAGEPAADENVIVYTNADLESLEPIPTQDAPIAGDDRGWEFVKEVLEQGYARLDADRAYELDRARVEAETRESTRLARRSVYALALAPYGYPRRQHRSHEGKPGPVGDFANRPVPLHARPSSAGTGNGNRLSGADVFHGPSTSGRPNRGRTRPKAR